MLFRSIGMAPGVGKTYKMLEGAHQLKGEGIDVVGVLETHGRKETADKAVGLELIPKRTSRDRLALQEMDTEAILARSPHCWARRWEVPQSWMTMA